MALQLDITDSVAAPPTRLLPAGLVGGRRPHSPEPLLRVGSAEDRRLATVEIVVPVYNEAAGLDTSIRRLHDYLSTRFPIPWLITVADNASIDQTWPIACSLAAELDGVNAVHLELKGRGRALRAVWAASDSAVVAYMDVDLSTDLDGLLPLIAPLVSGHSDVAIGTRLAPNSRVVRGPRREAISRSYNLLLRTTLRSGFSDAQCGFKAVRTDVARTLLPLVEDNGWFFDTELLVLAEANGLRIHEVPVDWVDDPDSRVDVVSTASADLRGVMRMARRMARGETRISTDALRRSGRLRDGLGAQLVRFASIGVVSTIVFAALFALLRPTLGAVGADIASLGLCAVANTAANRRLTFSLRGRSGRGRDLGAGVALAVFPLILNLTVLAIMAATGVTTLASLVIALTLANGAASLVRFLMLRNWVFAGADR
jgi:putative flippase GtrA